MATAARDPRDVVTPEAFRVADHLIGTPLAKPSRRLGAILVDLLLVAILVGLLDALAFVIALVGAFFVFRLSRVRKEGRWYSRFYRHGLGCFGALLTFIALIIAMETIGDFVGGADEEAVSSGATIDTDSARIEVEGLGLVETAALLLQGNELRSATRPGERDSLADEVIQQLLDAGMTPAEARATVVDLADDDVLPPEALGALEAAIETTSARREDRAPRSAAQIRAADSTARAEAAAALAAAASLPADSAGERADSMRLLRAALDSLNAELERERAERAAEQERSEGSAFRWVLSSISDELGLGIGWLGLYFTAFTVLGGGQTPGKRLFRLRVIRLDGRPIGWWTSLQRFGGYSASVFTGMLGFAEMFWDDNRQALQDKLAFTVVIHEPKTGERGTARPLDPVADRIAQDDADPLEPAPPQPAAVPDPLVDPAGTPAPAPAAPPAPLVPAEPPVRPLPPVPPATPPDDADRSG